jgi:phosphatidylglycerophosphate synthase
MKEKFAGDKKVGKSTLHYWEQRFVKWGTPKIPHFLETYTLTYMTIIWSAGAIGFGYAAQFDIRWLWGTTAMIVCQYLSDLFDGAVGRYRNTGLVKWGYYMDHFLDYIFMCCLLIGYTFFVPDPFNNLFYILIVYGAFLVNAFISFAATNEFRVSYFGFGPTEGRIGFIATNTLIILYGKTFMAQFLPHLLTIAFFSLIVVVYKTQKVIWKADMKEKKG